MTPSKNDTHLHGWCGRIAQVDLSHGTTTTLDTMAYARRFLGGRGIAARLYWELVSPDARALGPENHLIFMTGPLGATGAQGASRFVVVGKSPMTLPEGFCFGNLGGHFGPWLKRAGFDGLVITGQADKPVYLYINDGQVSIRNASDLWGKGVYAVQRALKTTHGPSTRMVTTGIAGENLCRSANIMTDNEGSATGGFGAVMGAKQLKAIAVTGTGKISVADPKALKSLNHRVLQLSRKSPLPLPFPPDQVQRVGQSSCYQCGLDCMYRHRLKTASGDEMVRKCQSMSVYLPWVAGRPEESAETAVKATGICNDLSLCTMEMANIIRFLYACSQSGYLTEKETGLNMSQLGTLKFFERLARMISQREGFGEVLAQGLLRAGETLGDKAKAHFTPAMSGVGDGATYSGREYLMNALLYAFSPRQPMAMLHEISRLTGMWVMHQNNPEAAPVSSDVFRKVATRFWGHEKAWDLMTHEGKAQAAVAIIDRTCAKDSLVLCDSCWPVMVSWHTPDRVGDPTLESRTFTAVTGIETDEAGLNAYGERIFNLERAIMIREGHRPLIDDDVAPYHYTEPVRTVFMNPDALVPGPGNQLLSRKGMTLDRTIFNTMRKEFYALRGWDSETGLQPPWLLKDLK